LARRQPAPSIHLESSEGVIRLFEGDTWARLLHVENGEPVPEYRVFTQPSPQVPLVANLDDQVLLVGYDLERAKGEAVQVTLYWQALRKLDANYTVFAQLLGSDGDLKSQVDSIPQDGGYPTIWWLPGEVIADTHTLELPANLPSGSNLRLIAGLYDPATGARLPVVETGADFVDLGVVRP
jgi:hypothetical protein